MSNYIQALKRLERDREIDAPPAAARESVRRGERPAREAADAAPARPLAAPAAASQAEASGLLDRLRMLAAQGVAARVLVFAPVMSGAATRRVVDRLTAHARTLGMSAAGGELTRAGGQAALAERAPRAGEARPPRPLDIDDAPGLAAGLRAWLEPLAGTQLVTLEAPALASSVDAVLLAGACDGLVLVAETGVTTRAALAAAAARARDAGCTVLGVVLTGA